MFRWYLRSIVIWSLSKQVMNELRVTGIVKKVNSIIEDQKYVFVNQFHRVKYCRVL